ncbi:hypothetical protein D5086_027538 [Populus alba]|uniref:Uncharacterized protein n=1 Tax=Populus alba TaxID=43335 RepID=A0ACC4AW97_POPAL
MRRAHCTFLLCFAFIFAVLSKADQPINKFRPHVHEPFSPGSCAYTVVISTSCLSPKYTTDQISIIFGDAFGNQVTGSCSLEICYVYFYRNGTVGWIPQSVEIYGSFSTPAVFFFNSTTVPEGEWDSCYFHIFILLTSYNILQQYDDHSDLFRASLLLLFAISGLLNTKRPL